MSYERNADEALNKSLSVYASEMQKIKLTGKLNDFFGDRDDVYLVGGSSIATKEQYDNFETSLAYLAPNGSVMWYGAVIGSKDDILFTKS